MEAVQKPRMTGRHRAGHAGLFVFARLFSGAGRNRLGHYRDPVYPIAGSV